MGRLWQLPRQDPGVWGFQPSQLTVLPNFHKDQEHRSFRTSSIAHPSLYLSIVNKDSVDTALVSEDFYCPITLVLLDLLNLYVLMFSDTPLS